MRLVDTTEEVLYENCVAVDNPTSLTIKMFRDRMKKIMIKERGIGLAAPQVGKSIAMFLMVLEGRIITCINPSISWESENIIEMKEGCLSFPNTWIKLKRPEKIIANWVDLKGRKITKTLDGVESRCFQHELDHLSGITFIHRQNEQV